MDIEMLRQRLASEMGLNSSLRDEVLQARDIDDHGAVRPVVSDEDIAIVGMSCRFPGGQDPWEFYRSLMEGRDLFSGLPDDRWPDASGAGTQGLKVALLDDVLSFDHKTFSLSARESEALDPHHRLLLEEVQRAIIASKNDPTNFGARRTGVFVAMYNQDFAHYARWGCWEDLSKLYLATGNAHCILANRISYLFNLQGPSEIIDTACSSALVALHRACQAIRSGECEQAVVGAVSLLLEPGRLSMLNNLGLLSNTGICSPFDQAADGQVMGEGVGAVILKTLGDARRDGDPVLGVIVGSAVQHQGKGDGSLVLPSADAQRTLVENLLSARNLAPSHVSYVEAHGNGGGGDGIELQAMQSVYGPQVRLGSVKGNVGFLEAAGGFSQLAKVLGAIRFGVMPATRNHQQLPASAGTTPILKRPSALSELAAPASFIAAINSYGLGGVNAHLLVTPDPDPERQAPAIPPIGANRRSFPLPRLMWETADIRTPQAPAKNLAGTTVPDMLTAVCAWTAKQAQVELAQVDVDQPISRLGLDSIALTGFCSLVRRALDVNVQASVFGASPTPLQMADALETLIQSRETDVVESLAALAGVLDILPGNERVPVDLLARQYEIERQYQTLSAELGPPGTPALAALAGRYRQTFDLLQDTSANLWVFLHMDEGNTFDLPALEALVDILTAASQAADAALIKGVFLSHRGRNFSLGGNRQAFVDDAEQQDHGALALVAGKYRDLLDLLEQMPCLTYGIAYGSAQGGGFELLMALDYQFIWPGVMVGVPEIKSGLIAGMGGVSYLASVVGAARAATLNLTGELLPSEAAVDLGLLSALAHSPFRDAQRFDAGLPNKQVAVRIMKLLRQEKLALMRRDITAWVASVNAGEFIEFSDKIREDFQLIAQSGVVQAEEPMTASTHLENRQGAQRIGY